MRLLALTALLALAAGPALAKKPEDVFCVLPAKIMNGAASVAGQITAPVTAALRPNSRAPFSGMVNIVFPDSKCPTPATLSSALSKAYLATPKGWKGVSVAPSTAAVVLPTMELKVADVSVTGLTGDIVSRAGHAGMLTPTVTATGGQVHTKSSLAQINPFPLKGRSLSVSGTGCQLKADGAKVTFTCPNLQANGDVSTSEGAADLSLQGALTAVGELASAVLVPVRNVPKPPQ